jgi:hypothetical protein
MRYTDLEPTDNADICMIVNADGDLIVNADLELHVYLPARATRAGTLERVGRSSGWETRSGHKI